MKRSDCMHEKKTGNCFLRGIQVHLLLPALLLYFFLLGLSIDAQAQEFQDADIKISQMLQGPQPTVIRQGERLQKMIHELNPTLFLGKDGQQLEGDSPVVLDFKPEALSLVYRPQAAFENIELMYIRIQGPEELNFQLRMNQLEHFNNLSYVFLLLTFELCPENPGNVNCYGSKLQNIVSGYESESGIRFVYKVSPRL